MCVNEFWEPDADRKDKAWTWVTLYAYVNNLSLIHWDKVVLESVSKSRLFYGSLSDLEQFVDATCTVAPERNSNCVLLSSCPCIIKQKNPINLISLSFISPEHSVAAKTGGCFPGDAQVILEGGATKQMSELHPGDRVLASSTTDGALLYSPVLSFLDRQPNVTKIFYIIGTNAGLNITLTAAHLIFVTDCTGGPREPKWEEEPLSGSIREGGPSWEAGLRTVFASEVQPGQCVLTSQGKVGSLSVVTFVEEQRSAGLYAPLTQHGSIVVNGVLASCYAVVDNHRLAHWVLAPLRFFYSLMGPSEAQTDGLHWYPWFLQKLGLTLLDAGHFHPWGVEQARG